MTMKGGADLGVSGPAKMRGPGVATLAFESFEGFGGSEGGEVSRPEEPTVADNRSALQPHCQTASHGLPPKEEKGI